MMFWCFFNLGLRGSRGDRVERQVRALFRQRSLNRPLVRGYTLRESN